jgi:alginate O-acetyltransferase complex protein AlgI
MTFFVSNLLQIYIDNKTLTKEPAGNIIEEYIISNKREWECMVFSSLQFIGIFLPIFFLIYYLTPKNMKNAVVFIGSLVFYFIGTTDHLEHYILFLLSIMINFWIGIFIDKFQKQKKLILIIGLIYNFGALFCFKYLSFVAGEVNSLFPGLDMAVKLVLPIGISFYTFQGVSYIIDVYRGTVPVEKNLLNYGTYLSMYAQLIAGPIVVYDQVRKELHKRRITINMVATGLGIFIFGLGMKVLLANPLGKLWGQLNTIGYESISTPLAWMGIIGFSFQLYFDFFGYSLMAVGLGRMMGFRLPKNFNHPYISCSMTEFWRRWHITLSSWFRDYVYISLGGNRVGKLAHIRNLFIVWIFTGIWHGAGYNFVLWGVVLFLILIIEKYFLKKYLDKWPVVGHLYMILLIPLTWAIFAIEDIGQLGVFFTRLFPFFGQGPWSIFELDYVKYWNMYYPFLLVGILFSTKLPYKILKRLKHNKIIVVLLLLIILIASVYCMYQGYDDPFLYFRF